jgi:Ala-tRNA(Pro) deacylase
MDICAFLDDHGITYEKFDHPAVFTVEESNALDMKIPGKHTKNLFLRDKKGKRHILVTVAHEKQVDLKALAEALNVQQNLSFASPERLKQHLGVTPGSVTLLGLVNDTAHAVEFVIDQDVWDAEAVGCHPLTNTATLVVPHAGIEAFLTATGHQPKIIRTPPKSE